MRLQTPLCFLLSEFWEDLLGRLFTLFLFFLSVSFFSLSLSLFFSFSGL